MANGRPKSILRSMSQRFLSELWSILLFVGRPTLLGGLALILLALAGLWLTRKHRMPDPRDGWKRATAVLAGLLALLPIAGTAALAAMELNGLAVPREGWMLRAVKAIPGTESVAVILLFWLTARLAPKRRSFYALYGIACIFTALGGSVMLIYVLR